MLRADALRLEGKRFGRLLVLERGHCKTYTSSSTVIWHWTCRCDCGNKKEIAQVALRSGRTVSCGCVYRESRAFVNLRHGYARAGSKRSSEYSIWDAMLQRCTNPHNAGYPYYGGRGINVCKQWQYPGGFIQFYKDMGSRPDGLTLDRIDSNGDYTPDNCRWASRAMQSQNTRRTKLNETKVKRIRKALQTPYLGVQADLARKYNVDPTTIKGIKQNKNWVGV